MKIYVAARYNADNVMDVLKNIGEAVEAGVKVAEKGHVPFVPHLDCLLHIFGKGVIGGGIEFCYKTGLEWLKCCDGILIVNGLEDSKGVKREFEYAKEHNMKIYYSIEEIPQ